MRNAFAATLVAAARSDPRILLLTGDHGYALFDEIRRVCPDQYINAGVAEQNMVGVAAGLAKGGFRPIVYGLSAFVPVRVLEQIKMDVCYEKLPVIFIGDGAGVVYGTLGASHQSCEDIAALRSLPNLSILSPADAFEMSAAMKLALAASGPVYLRMGKADLGSIHEAEPSLEWGRLLKVREGHGPLAWIATGSMVVTALAAACDWPDSAVWSAPSLKPLDADRIVEAARGRQAVITLEEHSIYGGLGSAVAEATAERCPMRACRIGINDRFSERCGGYGYLMGEHALDVESVKVRVEGFVANLSSGVRSAA
jgi:transketolase